MEEPSAVPPRAAVPSRLHRRLRLGPFPSGRDALKFLAYAAVAAILAPTTAPLLGAPIVLVGLLVAVYKPGGEALDERAAVLLRYALRRRGEPVPMSARVPRGGLRGSIVPLGDGRSAAIVRTAGVPLAYLPPAELARRFELFRQLLRSIEGDLFLLVTSTPIFPDPIVPDRLARGSHDASARGGYRELVTLLARRRAVRRVYLGLASTASGEETIPRLEAAMGALLDSLAALGIGAERLRDRPLADAATRLGLGGGPHGS